VAHKSFCVILYFVGNPFSQCFNVWLSDVGLRLLYKQLEWDKQVEKCDREYRRHSGEGRGGAGVIMEVMFIGLENMVHSSCKVVQRVI
jgi:hypothetical protein